MDFDDLHISSHISWKIIYSQEDLILSLSEVKWKSLGRVQLFGSPWIVHGILQARILEWVAFPFPRESSQPRDQTQVSV